MLLPPLRGHPKIVHRLVHIPQRTPGPPANAFTLHEFPERSHTRLAMLKCSSPFAALRCRGPMLCCCCGGGVVVLVSLPLALSPSLPLSLSLLLPLCLLYSRTSTGMSGPRVILVAPTGISVLGQIDQLPKHINTDVITDTEIHQFLKKTASIIIFCGMVPLPVNCT